MLVLSIWLAWVVVLFVVLVMGLVILCQHVSEAVRKLGWRATR
jgi:hypothetical protein